MALRKRYEYARPQDTPRSLYHQRSAGLGCHHHGFSPGPWGNGLSEAVAYLNRGRWLLPHARAWSIRRVAAPAVEPSAAIGGDDMPFPYPSGSKDGGLSAAPMAWTWASEPRDKKPPAPRPTLTTGWELLSAGASPRPVLPLWITPEFFAVECPGSWPRRWSGNSSRW